MIFLAAARSFSLFAHCFSRPTTVAFNEAIFGVCSFAVIFCHGPAAAPFMDPEGWGVLPHMGYIGMCDPKGFFFQLFWS